MKIKKRFAILLALSLFSFDRCINVRAMDAWEEDSNSPPQVNSYTIDFKTHKLQDLKNLDFEHEEVTLLNLTSQKFNVIKPSLEAALTIHLEGDKIFSGTPSIKVLQYSIDENVKKMQRAVDEFMYAVASTKKVEVKRLGEAMQGELAPDEANFSRNSAQKYWDDKEEEEREWEEEKREKARRIRKEDRSGMKGWEKAYMDGAEGSSSDSSGLED